MSESAGAPAADADGPSPSTESFFDNHLRRLAGETLPVVVREAPLPLSCLDRLDQAVTAEFSFFYREMVKVHVVTHSGPALAVALKPRPWISLIYVQRGELAMLADGKWLRCTAGGCLVVPGVPLHWQSSSFSVICLMVAEPVLPAICKLLSLQDGRTADGLWCVDSLLHYRSDCQGLEAVLVAALQRSLLTMGDVLSLAPALLDRLDLDRQLAQLVALFAFPILHHVPVLSEPVPVESCTKDDFDRLIDYISSNLDQPLNLTLLQAQIHYSRRAIQYAFRQRLGCTATQWIRGQRLDRAHRLLGQAAPGETVAGIAKRCGYRSMSLFSIDFQQRFHVKPSALLREASFQQSHASSEEAPAAGPATGAKIEE